MVEACHLCQHQQTHVYYRDRQRAYLRCPNCGLVFVVRMDLLSPEEEKARYDLHQNSPDDVGFRQFLSDFMNPMIERIGPPPLDGLDFGSGQSPVLAMMLEEQGYRMSLYDVYYAPQTDVLAREYDFVTCTETIEHFVEPLKEWSLLISLVKPGGWLGIMTQMVQGSQRFSDMHYITDRTHVSFFSRETFQFLAERDGLYIEFEGDNLIFFRRTTKCI